MKTQLLLKKFQSRLDGCTSKIEKFSQELLVDPAYSLAWGDEAFRTAAELRVLKQLVNDLGEEQATIKQITAALTIRVLYGAKYPSHSTSPTSNLIAQYELAACASLLAELDFE